MSILGIGDRWLGRRHADAVSLLTGDRTAIYDYLGRDRAAT
jgi:hypothetical protein